MHFSILSMPFFKGTPPCRCCRGAPLVAPRTLARLRHGRVHEKEATVVPRNKNGEIFQLSQNQQDSRDFQTRSVTGETGVRRSCELSHHKPSSHLLGPLLLVTPTFDPDFAVTSARGTLETGALFSWLSSRFMPAATSSLGRSSSVSSSTHEPSLTVDSNSDLLTSCGCLVAVHVRCFRHYRIPF